MRSSDDLAVNLASCRELTGRAASEGAQLVVLPENFAFLGRREGDKLPIAESLEGTGPVMTMLRELATKHAVWIVGGGTPELMSQVDNARGLSAFMEKHRDRPAEEVRALVEQRAKRTYNTAVVIDPRGELVARYRKIHLFDLDIPDGVTLRESDATAPGDEVVVVVLDGAPVGVTICYDLRFPELYRRLVKDQGAEVLLVPAAFTALTGAAHWELLLRARAVEDQAWVVAAAQWGKHNEKRESFGHTMVVDPWGTIVGQRAEGDGVVVATLDGATVAKRRTQMPCLEHAVLWK